MTQSELNRAVALKTGETVRTVAQRGFSLCAAQTVDREPLVVDWDEIDSRRLRLFPSGPTRYTNGHHA